MFLERIKQITRKQWATMALIFAGMSAVTACAQVIDKIVKVDTPPDAVSEADGITSRMNLRDSRYALAKYAQNQTLIVDTWSERIEDGEFIADAFRDISMQATAPETLSLFGVNPTAPAAALGLYALGLFTRRPGDPKPAKEV